MAPSLVRLARNQALFREVNERINEISEGRGFVEFVCECSSTDCSDSVALRKEEYEWVRGDPARFFVAPGHVVDGVEVVVADYERFVVVEKTTERKYLGDVDPRTRTER